MGTGDLFNETKSFEEPIFYKDLSKKEGLMPDQRDVEKISNKFKLIKHYYHIFENGFLYRLEC